MDGFSGNEPYEDAARTLRAQIDAGFPVPMLVLRHSMRKYRDYVWHWFLINGYDEGDSEKDPSNALKEDNYAEPHSGRDMLVKAVTYSEYTWLNFRELWNTGYEDRGGMIIFSKK